MGQGRMSSEYDKACITLLGLDPARCQRRDDYVMTRNESV
jgi:hypothetical protein